LETEKGGAEGSKGVMGALDRGSGKRYCLEGIKRKVEKKLGGKKGKQGGLIRLGDEKEV